MTRVTGSEAYRIGGALLLLAIAAILTAFGFEHIGGYRPCELCLMQRWAYYFAIPAAFAGMALVSAEQGKLAALVFFTIALAFLGNAGLGVYQAGAEWKLWAGPATCTGQQSVATDARSLIEAMKATNVVRCDEAQIRILFLSFAGWNAIISLLLFAAGLKAAFAAADQR
ncbi:MAG: disulfide bond formation protein B [Hyphomicrobiaceae bacterium]|nr:disulfide bond formation protein B [Hyphomicrobiaceae bacterium]MCC0007145.1 disulfide bond formation protein B [Hyphomicrobiaceae bacterium]